MDAKPKVVAAAVVVAAATFFAGDADGDGFGLTDRSVPCSSSLRFFAASIASFFFNFLAARLSDLERPAEAGEDVGEDAGASLSLSLSSSSSDPSTSMGSDDVAAAAAEVDDEGIAASVATG